ncbi:LTA synthase family protein [Bacillus alkalisoli]|uniref:LTA synthase family protein n=1 Tax=Bacillus alkalisoli TaxID=2011008 RepID=UPI000C231CCE|nr:LTA synthase family protein [Bacillus alkalisoli]
MQRSGFLLLSYFVASLLFMEILFRIISDNHAIELISTGLFYSTLFSISLAFLLCVFVSTKWITLNKILTIIVLFIMGILYTSQFIYHDVFKTIYNFSSAGNAGQVFGFKDTMFRTIKLNFHWILLTLLPAILLPFLFIRNKMTFHPFKKQVVLLYLFLFFLFHSVGLLFISFGDDHQANSAYDLYYKSSSPVLSVDRLGLFTTLRLDIQRHVTKWSPSVNIPLPPVEAGGKTEEEKKPPNNKEVEIKYNELEIDFDTLIEKEQDEGIKQLHYYFQQRQPSKKNEYTGKFEGYNFIFITAEAFAPYAAHKEVTPTLYKLVNEGFRFTDFYVPTWDVSTSDGEYVATTGLIPKPAVWSYSRSSKNHQPFAMGNQLRALGYTTKAYHNYTYSYYDRDKSHPNMGYDYKGIGNGLNVEKSWPPSDLEMMKETIPEFIHSESFHVYYMTVSGHLEYNFFGQAMAWKNKSYVDHLDLSTQAQAYLATQVEFDLAMEYLLNELEAAGVLENTLIVISADHYPYGLDFETINELSGKEVDIDFGIHKSELIIYAHGEESIVINEPTSSLDIMPTISNLLGIEFDSRLLMGRDIFSDIEPLVIFRDRSFITKEGKYLSRTGEFTPNEGTDVDQPYIDRIANDVNQRFYVSSRILDLDYYRRLLFDK